MTGGSGMNDQNLNPNLDFERINAKLFDFLDRSPVPFFAILNMRTALEDAGFTELCESERWELEAGGAYFVIRNDSALIAFRIPTRDFTGFQIMASHCDSPVFKIKPNADITVENKYVKLNVEKYGGAVCAPWLDRPLSVAGRVIVETEDGIETRLVNIDRDLLIIPNLAIHFNRQINEGYKFNIQKDMLPLLGEISDFSETGLDSPQSSESLQHPLDWSGKAPHAGATSVKADIRNNSRNRFLQLAAREAGVSPDKILDTDLYLYSRTKACRIGMENEYIVSGRLDDLQCAFASLQGILQAEPSESIAVHCVFDNEEVGSGSKQGAGGTFLLDVLHRINVSMGRTEEEYLRAVASSFMVSADNAHAVHPNHPDKSDPTNRPYMNEGIVIKYNASQKYVTDAVSGAVFRTICKKAGVPYQTFTNRSDLPGGSTLGHIAQEQVSLNAVDIGLPQLAMHSACETAGARDTAYLVEAARVLFSGSLRSKGDGKYVLRY